jgi:hypothetical protein
MFGFGKRNALIRELLEQRMRAAGFDDMDSRLKVKQLGTLKLASTPEGTIVGIIERVIREQSQGIFIVDILKGIENSRRRLGGMPPEFNQIIRHAIGDNPHVAIFEFCAYRIEVEHYGVMEKDQVYEAADKAAQAIAAW